MRLVGADGLRDGTATLSAMGDVIRDGLGPGAGRPPPPPDEYARALYNVLLHHPNLAGAPAFAEYPLFDA